MITAVDTSVLLAIYLGEPDAEAWVERLILARSEGSLAICDVVAAEFFAAVLDQEAFDQTLDDLGVILQKTTIQAACLAGAVFRAYRDKGGTREHLVPDFLVAAHAMTDCGRLATKDRGYYRRYFKGLNLLQTEESTGGDSVG